MSLAAAKVIFAALFFLSLSKCDFDDDLYEKMEKVNAPPSECGNIGKKKSSRRLRSFLPPSPLFLNPFF